jgi:DNA repair protein RadD
MIRPVQRSLFDEPVEIRDGMPVLLTVQQDLLERGREAYGNGVRRAIWQASCGSGKTIVAAEQTRRTLDKGGTVLHIVHRRRLVDQMINTLAKFHISASPIMEGRQQWESSVYCASRDTLLSLVKDSRPLPKTTLIVWDECHTAAQEVQAWYLQNHPFAFWTGYTATPVKPNGDSMNPPYQKLVCMAPASELLKIGRLCPAKVYNPDAIGQRRRKGEKVKPVGDPVDHWKRYAAGLPTVVFAANVKDSQAICQRYNDAGITAEHIDASTPDDEREAVFERSRTGVTMVICNVAVMIEGVDLPWLACCQILRGCNSLVLWIQATGRVLRSYPGKLFGIVLDHSGAAHEFGMPDADFQWTLEDGAANAKKNKPSKDRKPVCCLGCGAVFVGKPACPECGKVLSAKQRKAMTESKRLGDGVLTEFTGEQGAAVRQESLERTFKKIYYTALAQGRTMSAVAKRFETATKIKVWKAGLQVNLPSYDQWKTPCAEWKI